MTVLFRVFGEELNILVIVDFDEGNSVGAVIALQHVDFGIPKKDFIKRARLLKIVDVQRHMGQAQNARAIPLLSMRRVSSETNC